MVMSPATLEAPRRRLLESWAPPTYMKSKVGENRPKSELIGDKVRNCTRTNHPYICLCLSRALDSILLEGFRCSVCMYIVMFREGSSLKRLVGRRAARRRIRRGRGNHRACYHQRETLSHFMYNECTSKLVMYLWSQTQHAGLARPTPSVHSKRHINVFEIERVVGKMGKDARFARISSIFARNLRGGRNLHSSV